MKSKMSRSWRGAATAMAVNEAAGENVVYILQLFFALPVVAIAGIGISRVRGHKVVNFLVSCTTLIGAAPLLI